MYIDIDYQRTKINAVEKTMKRLYTFERTPAIPTRVQNGINTFETKKKSKQNFKQPTTQEEKNFQRLIEMSKREYISPNN